MFQKAAIAIAASSLLAAATADIEGPYYPPPGSPDFAESSDGGWPSLTGGVTWTYTGHGAVEMARGLYYGKDTRVTLAASLDGPIEPSEAMAFNGISGTGGNVATWVGQSAINVWNGSWYQSHPVQTRFVMTITALDGTPIPFALPASIDGTFPTDADAASRVRGDFNDHWVLEALWQGTWTPITTLYDSLQTPPNQGTAFDLGSCYFTDDECPADLADPIGLLDLADVLAFGPLFLDEDPRIDLAAPIGIIDLEDILVFVQVFLGGCP